MRGRIFSCALLATAMVAALSSRVEAQVAPRTNARPAAAWANWTDYPDSPGPETKPSNGQVAREMSPGTFGSASVSDQGWSAGDSACSGGDCVDPGLWRCANCSTPYGFAAGAEGTYLSPDIEDGGVTENFGDFGFEAAPRIWLHWQEQNCWGLRARYWDFDAQQQVGAAVNLEDDDTLAVQTFDDDLEAYAVDFEITRTFALGCTDCWASFGVRHGRLRRHQTLALTIFDLDGGGGDDATAIFQQLDRDFRGTGITFALDMRRPLADSRLAAVCNLRGSVLWGDNELDISGAVIEVVPVGAGDLDLNDFEELAFFGRNGQGMWIGEIQVGGEWNTPISNCYGGGNAFFRLLFEAQCWDLPGVTAGEIVVGDQMHSFVGITIAAGLTR